MQLQSTCIENSVTTHIESPQDAIAIERLYEDAIGAVRFTRAAHFLRGQTPHRPELSFVAKMDGHIRASVRLTDILVGDAPLMLLGPLVVEPVYKGQGLGRLMMQTAIAAADAHQVPAILLVGDAPYYGRFGFEHVPENHIFMPAPTDPNRILIRPGTQPASDFLGVAQALQPLA